MTREQQLRLKRAVDVAGALAALAATAPALVAGAGAVRLFLGAPVLFRQRRPGLGGRPFELLKLRTMKHERAPDGRLLSDEERLTRLGRLLRATSVDELPQLLNVLRGDMSLVGPRPLLMRYLERYDARQARRHEVLPGITGLTQVRGRNALTWDEKFELDVRYVDGWSLWLDLRILLETVGAVLRRRGISNGAHATMPEFLGRPGPGGRASLDGRPAAPPGSGATGHDAAGRDIVGSDAPGHVGAGHDGVGQEAPAAVAAGGVAA